MTPFIILKQSRYLFHIPVNPGDNTDVEPPVPIPNTEVKSSHVDGSVAFAM